MIVPLCGPIIAMILFLMPMYAIQKVPAMRKYSGHISNVFVVIMGLIAISAIFYSLFSYFIQRLPPRRFTAARFPTAREYI